MINFKKKYLLTILTILLSLNTLYAADTNNTKIRIMPLGDSLTYDNTYADDTKPRPIGQRKAYRSYLWYMLKDVNYSADFVGSQHAGQDIRPAFDPDNEGHPGWTSFEIAEKVYGYLARSKPDIVLLHAGTNDHTEVPRGVESILQEIDYYESISGKNVRVIVALLMDRKESDPRINIYNEKLAKLVDKRIRKGDNLQLVNMNRDAKVSSSHYVDPTHPDSFGYRRMAQVWFKALTAPYSQKLRIFPTTLVKSSYIQSVSFNDTKKSVTFTTKIPNTGIVF